MSSLIRYSSQAASISEENGPWLILDTSKSIKSRISQYLSEKHGLERSWLKAWHGFTFFSHPSDDSLVSIVQSIVNDQYIRRFINSASVCPKLIELNKEMQEQWPGCLKRHIFSTLPHGDDSKIYRLQVYPRVDTYDVAALLSQEINFHPKKFTHVLHILRVSQEICFIGVTEKKAHFEAHKESWEDKDAKCVSRAYFKLRDAIDKLPLKLRQKINSDSFAIDIGASPGGWTQYLQKTVGYTASIDPANLDESILGLDNVVHFQQKSSDAFQEISKQYHLWKSTHDAIDLLVCDANKPVEEVMQLLEPYEKLMEKGSVLVLTLKFLHNQQKGAKRSYKNIARNTVVGLLEKTWKDIKIDWLLSNRLDERTITAIKR